MTIERLKTLIKDKSKIDNFLRDHGRNFKKDNLLKIIFDEEGLNEPIITPAKLSYSSSDNN